MNKNAHRSFSPLQKSVTFLILSKYTYAAKAYFRQMSPAQKRRMLLVESKRIARLTYRDILMRPSESALVDYWLHSIEPIPNVFGGLAFPTIKVAVSGERTRADATGDAGIPFQLTDEENEGDYDWDEADVTVDRDALQQLMETDEEADHDTEADAVESSAEKGEPDACTARDRCALHDADEKVYDLTELTDEEARAAAAVDNDTLTSDRPPAKKTGGGGAAGVTTTKNATKSKDGKNEVKDGNDGKDGKDGKSGKTGKDSTGSSAKTNAKSKDGKSKDDRDDNDEPKRTTTNARATTRPPPVRKAGRVRDRPKKTTASGPLENVRAAMSRTVVCAMRDGRIAVSIAVATSTAPLSTCRTFDSVSR